MSTSAMILALNALSIAFFLLGWAVCFTIVFKNATGRGEGSGALIGLQCIFFAAAIMLISRSVSLSKQNTSGTSAYKKFRKAAASDSEYTIYYNGSAISGSSIDFIDKDNIDDFDITYHSGDKTVDITKKK